ncbi:MAG: glycosyltransferase [Vicinamibacterales bacterium]
MGSSNPGPPAASLRVLHLVATANGAAWVHEQLRDLRARGHDVMALVAGTDGTLAPRLDADGIRYEVADLDVFAGGSARLAARRILTLARTFRRLRPDVVQSHVFSSIVLGRLAAWLADVPVRLSMIPGPYYLEAPGLSGVDVRTAPLDTKVIASCEYTRELYERLGTPRAHVELIYYGQDPGRLDPATADPARVRRERGLDPARPVVGDVAYFYPPSPDGPSSRRTSSGAASRGTRCCCAPRRSCFARCPTRCSCSSGAAGARRARRISGSWKRWRNAWASPARCVSRDRARRARHAGGVRRVGAVLVEREPRRQHRIPADGAAARRVGGRRAGGCRPARAHRPPGACG